MLKEGEPLPEIFTDPAFGQSNHWELSTSQLSSRYLDGWGYGEGEFHIYIFAFLSFFCSLSYHSTKHFSFTVVPDGYGLSYSIGDDYIRWTITSLKRNTAELKHHLTEAATQVKSMLMIPAKTVITKL
jgi:carnitine O-acetyltransferase